MKQLFLVLLFSVGITFSYAQDTTAFKPGIPSEAYKELSAELKKNKVKPETISVETDQFGRIISVDSKQEKLVSILKTTILVPRVSESNELVAFTVKLKVTSASKLEGLTSVNVKTDTIAGQLYTAVKLSQLMAAKDTDAAEKLFSAEQQKAIKGYKEDRKFKQWISAWELDDATLGRYAKKIIGRKASFVFEDGAWRINEK